VTDDLPFVPTTCSVSYERCGSPSSAQRSCIRSSPKLQPIGSSPAR
jgi:hypothetical protein